MNAKTREKNPFGKILGDHLGGRTRRGEGELLTWTQKLILVRIEGDSGRAE